MRRKLHGQTPPGIFRTLTSTNTRPHTITNQTDRKEKTNGRKETQQRHDEWEMGGESLRPMGGGKTPHDEMKTPHDQTAWAA